MADTRPVVVVLDINGVLADVRKKSAAKPKGIQADLHIPSGQSVYMRAHLKEFSNYVRNLVARVPNMKVVMWTSRKADNALAIEEYLRDVHGLEPEFYMHGEDCRERSGFQPIKDVRILRRRLGSVDGYNCHVVFVDDSPEYIKLDDDSEAVSVVPYDVVDGERGCGIIGVVTDLHHTLKRLGKVK